MKGNRLTPVRSELWIEDLEFEREMLLNVRVTLRERITRANWCKLCEVDVILKKIVDEERGRSSIISSKQ